MTRLLFLLFFCFLLAGCETEHTRWAETSHRIYYLEKNTEKIGLREIEEITEELQQLAAKGYAPALLMTTQLFVQGYVPKSSKLVEANMLKLDELGYVDAKEQLAFLYAEGSGVEPPDVTKASHWFEQYLTTGYGVHNLAELYIDGILIPRDLDRAENLLLRELDLPHFYVLEKYGNLLLERSGERLLEAYVTFKVLERLSIDRLDEAKASNQEGILTETERLEIIVKSNNWHRSIINSGYEGPRLWQKAVSKLGYGFPELGSVTKLESYLREQAGLGAPKSQFLLARYLFSEYAAVDEPRMVEALHFAEKAAAKDYLPAVSLVAEIHLSKPNLSKAESSQYLAEMVSALEKGHTLRAESIQDYAWSHSNIHRDRQVFLLAEALSVLKLKLRKDHYSAVLAELDKKLTSAEITSAMAVATSYEFRPIPSYSNRPDTWPSIAHICIGFAGIIVCGFVFYLGWLIFRVRLADRSKNVFAALTLWCDSSLVLVISLIFTLPSSTLAQEIVQGLAHFLPLVIMGSMLGYYGLACQIETNFSRFLNLKKLKYGLAITGVCLFVYLMIDPLRLSQGYAWDSWQPPFNVLLGHSEGLVSAPDDRALLMLTIWVATMLVLLAATIEGLYSQQANNRAELTYYLKAYGAKFLLLVMPLAIYYTLAEMNIWGSWYIVNEGLPPTLYTSLGELVFAVLLAIGILRNQVFGIEQVFRKNTIRAVLGSMCLAGFFLVENIVGNHMQEDYGTLGGMIAALSILGLQNRLMFIVKPIVNSLFSDEMDQSFSDQMTTYLQVYRMATLDGFITEQEQTMLTATADGLNLNSTEIQAVEEFVKLEKGNRQV
ncbi:MAG: sel1 repeat family protein [Proteobacteria bacterium]|nr:sel1 repeat family protein [Pseudomonadota bacterium]